MTERGDAELVRAALAGDKEAYGELVGRYQGHVYGLAYSLVNDWTNAQDIAQETFIRAFCNLDQLREPEKFAAWLRRVTFGVAMNWLKAFRPGLFKQLDGKVNLESLEIPDFRPGPPEITEKRELAEAVLKALAALPPKYRVPLTMFHLDGLSYQKVADFLDIPLGTAKSLIHRAQEKLRAALPPALVKEMTVVQEVFNEHKLPREFAQKVIEGVEKLVGWGAGRESTFIEALSTAMRTIGEDVSYDYLMGVSGMAFRLQIHQPEWCASATDAGCGFNAMTAAWKAVGYASKSYISCPTEAGSTEKAREAIIRSIDEGLPVIAMDLEAGMDWGIITGYQEQGTKLVCRTKDVLSEEYSPAKKWPWLVVIIGRKSRQPDRRKTLLTSLTLAMKLARAKKFGRADGTGYLSGFTAYETWIGQLREDERFERMAPDKLAGLVHPNAWCYYSLLDARGAAARYLRSIHGEFGSTAEAQLLTAAGLYERIASALGKEQKHAPFPHQLRGAPCTKQMRHAQADTLQGCLSLEKEAISEIEKALRTVI